MANDNIYSVDSSALIHAWRRVYRPKNFGLVWKQFDVLIDDGRLRATIEVYNEVQKKDDELFKWCKDRKATMFVEIDDDCQQQVSRLLMKYPRLVDTVKGRSGADAFVIALAAANDPNMVVVTEEHPGRVRIPDVCDAEKIRYVGLADMIEEEDWKFEG